jgi:hypothetical protein
MATNLSKFNEQVLNFLQEMRDLFPEDKKLSTFYHTVEFMKKTNPREIMIQFKNFVYPFREKIISKDESFFINNDFSDSVNNDSSISEMLRIKEIWNSNRLSPNDKECVWNYFKVFLYLIDKEYANGNKQ